MTTTLTSQQDVPYVLLSLSMALSSLAFFSTAWLIMTSSRNGEARMETKHVWASCFGLSCAGFVFVFMRKWPGLIVSNMTPCAILFLTDLCFCARRRKTEMQRRKQRKQKEKKMELLTGVFTRFLDSQGNCIKCYWTQNDIIITTQGELTRDLFKKVCAVEAKLCQLWHQIQVKIHKYQITTQKQIW